MLTAEAASRLTWGLVRLDPETGMYNRAALNCGTERDLINEALLRDS